MTKQTTDNYLKPISYSFNSATQISGFSRSRIYRDIKAGKISFRKIGKRTMFLADEFERYVLNELESSPAIPYPLNSNRGNK